MAKKGNGSYLFGLSKKLTFGEIDTSMVMVVIQHPNPSFPTVRNCHDVVTVKDR